MCKISILGAIANPATSQRTSDGVLQSVLGIFERKKMSILRECNSILRGVRYLVIRTAASHVMVVDGVRTFNRDSSLELK